MVKINPLLVALLVFFLLLVLIIAFIFTFSHLIILLYITFQSYLYLIIALFTAFTSIIGSYPGKASSSVMVFGITLSLFTSTRAELEMSEE